MFKNVLKIRFVISFLNDTLPSSITRKSYSILLITLLGTFFEAIGIALIVPVISIILDDGFVKNNMSSFFIFEFIKHLSQEDLVKYSALAIMAAYIAKGAVVLIMYWKQAEYVFQIKAFLSSKLFSRYMNTSYDFFLENNSAQLIRNLTKEVAQVAHNVLLPIITLLTEVLVVVTLVLLLFYFEPLGALIVFSVSFFAIFIFQFFTKKHLIRWGKNRQFHEGALIQRAQEGFAGIKEIKLLTCEKLITDAYDHNNEKAVSFERKLNILNHAPRVWLEIVAVFGIMILIITLTSYGTPTSGVIPIVALFAASAFRMLPSSNRILTSIQTLRYADESIKLIKKEISIEGVLKKSGQNIASFNKCIELEGITFIYPSSNKKVLKNINLTINKNESIGIIGESGSGKSTLIDIILGLLKPTKGCVKVDGINIQSDLDFWYGLIGNVQQNNFLIDDSLKNNIIFGNKTDLVDVKMLNEAIEISSLNEFIGDLPDGLDTFVGERGVRLSGGQRQRICIARALYNKPQIIVFDEATSALDSNTERKIQESIKSLHGKRTMIIVSHRQTSLDYCDKVYKVENGQVTLLK
jgi:ABC-type multidrug transport system fused ATPase/permease subunit